MVIVNFLKKFHNLTKPKHFCIVWNEQQQA